MLTELIIVSNNYLTGDQVEGVKGNKAVDRQRKGKKQGNLNTKRVKTDTVLKEKGREEQNKRKTEDER